MQHRIWIYAFVMLVASAAGWYVYVHQQTAVTQTVAPTPPSNDVAVAPPRPTDDELNRKRQAGIGSIKDLRPVPLAPDAGAHK